MVRQERNWGLILGIISALVIYPVALLAGVSEETSMVRGLIGGAVGAFIGFGFNYLGAVAPVQHGVGSTLDVILSDIEEHSRDLDLQAASSEFHPMDLTQATRVIETMKD